MKTIDINPIDPELAKVNFVRLFYQPFDIVIYAFHSRSLYGFHVTAYCNSDVIL